MCAGLVRKNAVRSPFALIILLALMVPRAAFGETQQPVLGITDPVALRGLADRFGLQRMIDPAAPHSNSSTDILFALPQMAAVRPALDREFQRYVVRSKSADSAVDIGVGDRNAIRLFDRDWLASGVTQFVLVGIVNRMDRAYVALETCGEIRLIYRLMRTAATPEAASRLLPMTLNLVLHARSPGDAGPDCAGLAQGWLTAPEAALANVTAGHVDRIETNLQIAHIPKSATRAFRTDYLQKVFRRSAASGVFEEASLENQIDRDRLLADVALAQDFGAWLLAPEHLAQFDAGTVLIPERFLATGSVAATPAGFAPSPLHPAYGLMQADGADTAAVFTDDDVVSALARASAQGIVLQNIRSAAGFARRLNDISCGGCHQVRGIGGFHFPGVDVEASAPNGSPAIAAGVPASPHFIGDQPRRRDVVMAMRAGRAPDFSRGFSDRPQLRGDAALVGTGYVDGWGAHCYRAPASPQKSDASFTDWTCAAGLSCQAVDDDPRFGMCFVGSP